MHGTVKRIKLESQARLGALMRAHFIDLDAAARDPSRKVAWCTSVGPCEILTAMGFDVYFPENHGALLGARKISHEFIPRAVGIGYCAESCSYMTSDIGSSLAGCSPLREAFGIDGPPKPDLLVYNTNQCREVQEWWNYYGRLGGNAADGGARKDSRTSIGDSSTGVGEGARRDSRTSVGVPVLGVCPPLHLGEVTREHVAFVRTLLEGLVARIEEGFGVKLDLDRLKEVVTLSSKASTLWRRVLETARARPAALTFFDGAIHMAPVILMRGSRTAIDFYEALLAELEQRVAEGVGAVPDERFRIYWEGMPIWPKLRELSEKFYDLHAVVAASTYCNSWAFEEYDGGDPLAWMARTSLEIFINRDEPTKEAFLSDMIRRFAIDGIIFHNARTCPNNTNSRFGMPQRIRRAEGVPTLVIDGDLSDLRFFSTAQTMTNLEAFVEQLTEHRQ